MKKGGEEPWPGLVSAKTTMSIQTTPESIVRPNLAITNTHFCVREGRKNAHLALSLSGIFLSVRVASPRVLEREHDTGWRLPHDKASRDRLYIPEPEVYRVSCYTAEIKTARESARKTRGEGRPRARHCRRGRPLITSRIVSVTGRTNGDIAVRYCYGLFFELFDPLKPIT